MDGKGTTRVLVQSEKGAEIMKQVADDLSLIPVESDKLTEGVREMFHSVPVNPCRPQFFEDLNAMEPVAFFRKWFPITWKVRLNSFVRLTCLAWVSIRSRSVHSCWFMYAGTSGNDACW